MTVDHGPIGKFLQGRDVAYQAHEGGYYENGIITFRYTAKQLNIDVSIHYNETSSIYTIYAMTQDEFDMKTRSDILEIAAYANAGCRYGAMIVGEQNEARDTYNVWFRLTVPGKGEFSPEILNAMINNACGTLGDYYPALMKVVWGGMSSREALKSAFSDQEDDDRDRAPPPITGYE